MAATDLANTYHEIEEGKTRVKRRSVRRCISAVTTACVAVLCVCVVVHADPTGDPFGYVQVTTGSDNTNGGLVAVSNKGCASGPIAVSVAGCATNPWRSPEIVAVSGTGESNGSVAISVIGGAQGDGTRTWDPNHQVPTSCESPSYVAISVDGDACGSPLAVSVFGNASAWGGIAVSGTGSAQTLEPPNVGNPPTWVAVSGTGQANSWVAVSGTGPANASGGPAPVAISGTGYAVSRGVTGQSSAAPVAPIAVSGTSSAAACGGTAPVTVSGGALLGLGSTYPC